MRVKYVSILLGILTAITGAASLYFSYAYQKSNKKIERMEREKAIQETATAAQGLTNYILELKPLVDSLVETLNQKNLTPAEIEGYLQKKPLSVSGFGVAFLPNESPLKKRYAPYYVEIDNEQRLLNIADLYDYTAQDQRWFHAPLTSGPQFNDPYFGKTNKTILAEYAAPFYYTNEKGEKVPAGIVFANQSVAHLQHVLNTLFFGPTGYWFLLGPQGSFLVHPQQERVSKQQTIAQLAKEQNNNTLTSIAQTVEKREPVRAEYTNEITDAPSWLICEPLKETNWTLCGVFDKNELPLDNDANRHYLIFLSFGWALFFVFLIFFIATFCPLVPAIWWGISLSIGVTLALEVIFLWGAASLYPHYKKNLNEIKNKNDLSAYIKEKGIGIGESREEQVIEQKKETAFEKQVMFDYEKATFLPTGIFITHLQFTTEKQIEIVGYIWQRYHKKLHKNVSQGFILPQAVQSTITELSRTTLDDTETIIWRVEATINQRFNYDTYPFDVKNIQIQLWHTDFEKQVILIPDLDSYLLLNPHSLPGLSPRIRIGGWDIQTSYFGYKTNIYNSMFGMYTPGPFGITKQINKSVIPELYFDIAVKRNLIDTLIADLLPVTVISLLLFTILLTSVMQGYAVFGSCAAVFFGLAIAQFRFRAKIPSYQLVYFEHFYLILYTAIVAIAVLSILYLYHFNIWFIQYRKNLLAKLLYWPILLLWLIGVTAWYLY